MEQPHQRQPRLDRGPAGERGGKVFGEQARARAGHAAVHRAQQAARTLAILGRGDLQTGAARFVDRHHRAGLVDRRRQQEGHGPATGMVEIGEQAARRGEHRARERAERVERGDPVQLFQPLAPALARKVAGWARDGLVRRIGPVLRRNNLARTEAGKRGGHPVGLALLQLHPPGRDVARRDSHAPAQLAQCRQPIRAARFEQRVLGQRARSHEADDLPRDQHLGRRLALCLGACAGFVGRLDLLGNRDPVPGADQAGEIAVGGMHRHAAHRHRLPTAFAPAGQRDVEHAGGDLRIVEEQFEKVAHAVEQQALARLALERVVLFHHRSGFAGRHRIVAYRVRAVRSSP